MILVLESIDEVLGRKLPCGTADVAEEVARGVIVLAVGEAAQYSLGRHTVAGSFFPLVPESRLQLRTGERGKIADPGLESRFLGAAPADALAAAVLDAVGRLQQENGVVGILFVHQFNQRLAERLNTSPRGVRVGKAQPGGRGHAFRIVAGAASRLFHRLVKGTEVNRLRPRLRGDSH